MAPQPKKKLSRIRRGLRQSTLTIVLPNLVKCLKCGQLALPHTVCPSCGAYRKSVVLKPKAETKVTRVAK